MYNYREKIVDTNKLCEVSRASHPLTNPEGYSPPRNTNGTLFSYPAGVGTLPRSAGRPASAPFWL